VNYNNQTWSGQSTWRSIVRPLCDSRATCSISLFHIQPPSLGENSCEYVRAFFTKLVICLRHNRITVCWSTSPRSVGQFLPFQPALLEALIICAHSTYAYATWWCARNQATIFSLSWQHSLILCCQVAVPQRWLQSSSAVISWRWIRSRVAFAQLQFAIGFSLRRLVSKCANSFGINRLRAYFRPNQLGVGTSGGLRGGHTFSTPIPAGVTNRSRVGETWFH